MRQGHWVVVVGMVVTANVSQPAWAARDRSSDISAALGYATAMCASMNHKGADEQVNRQRDAFSQTCYKTAEKYVAQYAPPCDPQAFNDYVLGVALSACTSAAPADASAVTTATNVEWADARIHCFASTLETLFPEVAPDANAREVSRCSNKQLITDNPDRNLSSVDWPEKNVSRAACYQEIVENKRVSLGAAALARGAEGFVSAGNTCGPKNEAHVRHRRAYARKVMKADVYAPVSDAPTSTGSAGSANAGSEQ